MEPKRLYRSKSNRVFAGICGGLGDYFEMDPVILRLLWLLVVIFTGVFPGVVVYIIAIFLVPEHSPHIHEHHNHDHA
ncbi:PspC domain-containing protein [Candidatus Parcubacteria bacterium]|nr:PspC domain-containing protein [Candidatus Parcubacteria bacterium]